jgi:hypothetical protein
MTASTWTAERRARQSAVIWQSQAWLFSTGPRTPAGKARSSRNAAKPNSVRRQLLAMKAELKQVLRQAKAVDARRRAGRAR